MDSARKDVGAQVWAYVFREPEQSLVHSLTLLEQFLGYAEGRSQGWAGSLSVALPGSLGPSPNCHQNCMLLGYVYDFRARPTMWDDLGSERLWGFPLRIHLTLSLLSQSCFLLPLVLTGVCPASYSICKGSFQPDTPFSGQNPVGDSRLYLGSWT